MTYKFWTYVILPLLLLAVIATQIDSCGSTDRKELKKLEAEKEKLAEQVKIYKDSVEISRKEVEKIRKDRDTIYITRDIYRSISAERIKTAKETPSSEAELILDSMFEDHTAQLVQVYQHDSLKLEIRSLTDLYNSQVHEKLRMLEITKYQDTIINTLELTTANLETQNLIYRNQIKREKKKRLVFLSRGILIGFGVGGALVLLANNHL